MNDKISIIVPAYNISSFVAATLDSIAAQTYQNLEVIVVDDGSTDGTAQILDAYAAKEKRVQVIHKENGGVTLARLCGIRRATGDWIGFVDGDDYVEPGMYERLLLNAKAFQADISHCGYQMVFPKGHVDYYYNTGRRVEQDRITGLADLLRGAYVEPTLCNKLFRSSLFCELLEQEKMDCTIRNNEDLLMNYYLFSAAGKSVYEDVCPYHYILRENSAATARISEHKLKDPMRVIRILLKETENEDELHALMEERYLRQMIRNATMPTGSQVDLLAPYRKQIRKELRRQTGWLLKSPHLSSGLKAMGFLAALLPGLYAVLHGTYSRIKATDSRFSLDK